MANVKEIYKVDIDEDSFSDFTNELLDLCAKHKAKLTVFQEINLNTKFVKR